MNYIRLNDGLTKYKLVPATDEIWNHITTNHRDWYTSLYTYNEKHFKQWKETGTVSGIEDNTTRKLFFDFDNAKEPDKARNDSITVVTRLITKGVKQDNIQIAFSGNKGYSVVLDTTMEMTRDEFRNITFNLAGDLDSFDRVTNDNQRIVRVVGTKHNKSGLYKLPLTVQQLTGLPTSEIKALASSLDNVNQDTMNGWVEIELPKDIKDLKSMTYKEPKLSAVSPDVLLDVDLDLSKKPKWLTEAKYALQMGFFGEDGEGERNTAFMILASTYKSQGFPKEIAYRMLKGVAEIQSQRYNREQFSSKELWANITEVVYSPNWRGATYSYQNTPLLQDVTKRLGLKVETGGADSGFVPLSNVASIFKRFAEQIDNNTIKLGIPLIDKSVRVTTSMLVGLLAAPSAGKTSIAVNILNEASRNNVKAGFFSLDMGAPLVFQRLMQKHTGLSSDKIFEMYKTNDKRIPELETQTLKHYENVGFTFKSGVTTDHVRDFIIAENAKNPDNPMKLLVVDYLECIQGPYSDATANTAIISNQLKDIANEFEMCIILLLQPQKQAGDPSSELLSMRNIKGASVIEQACSVILTLWRPGFSPMKPEEDKYATIAVVKNRMGTIGNYSFNWDGLTGRLSELDELEKEELDGLRKRKAAEKNQQDL